MEPRTAPGPRSSLHPWLPWAPTHRVPLLLPPCEHRRRPSAWWKPKIGGRRGRRKGGFRRPPAVAPADRPPLGSRPGHSEPTRFRRPGPTRRQNRPQSAAESACWRHPSSNRRTARQGRAGPKPPCRSLRFRRTPVGGHVQEPAPQLVAAADRGSGVARKPDHPTPARRAAPAGATTAEGEPVRGCALAGPKPVRPAAGGSSANGQVPPRTASPPPQRCQAAPDAPGTAVPGAPNDARRTVPTRRPHRRIGGRPPVPPGSARYLPSRQPLAFELRNP
jgi:hypothetical protein